MEDCSICMCAVDSSTGHCTLVCKHTYHIACLTQWSSSNPSCPLCRHALGPTEVAPSPPPMSTPIRFRVDFEGVRVITADDALLPGPIVNSSLRDIPDDRMIPIGDDVRVPASDVLLVMAQADVPRHLAARALRIHDGDIVNAIMWLHSHQQEPSESEPDETVMTWFLQQMFEERDLYT